MTDPIESATSSRSRGKWRLLIVLAAAGIALPAASQTRPNVPPPIGLGGPPQVLNPLEDDSPMAQQMRKERNIMRQKKLESQMRLLDQLTSQLSAEVNAATISDGDVAKKTEQIGKLAKSIRELMIGPLS